MRKLSVLAVAVAAILVALPSSALAGGYRPPVVATVPTPFGEYSTPDYIETPVDIPG